MFDAVSFLFGFATGALGFLGLGLAIGAIEFRVTIDKDGVNFKKRDL